MAVRQKIAKLIGAVEKYAETDLAYLIKGTSWLFLGRLVIYGISFLRMVIFTQLVSPQIFGAYNYVISAITLWAVFSLPDMETALVRSIARGKDGTLRLMAKTKFRWSLIGSAGTLLFSAYYFASNNFSIGYALLFGSILLPFVYSFIGFSFFWQGRKKFDSRIKFEITLELLFSIFFIVTLLLTKNIVIIVLSSLLALAVLNFMFFRKAAKAAKNSIVDSASVVFGKQLTAINSISFISGQIDKVVIGWFLGPVSVAVYSVAQLPISKITGIMPIVPLALPKLGEKDMSDKDVKEKVFLKFKQLFIFAIPFSLAIIAISPLFYRIFFYKYMTSVPYFQTLALLMVLSPFSLLNTALITEMRKKELFAINTIPPFIKIALFIILTPFFGIWGIIYSTFISQIIGNALILYCFKKI